MLYLPSDKPDWLVAVAPGRLLALPAGLDRARVAALWDALVGQATVPEVLDLIIAGSIRSAPDFALAGWDASAAGPVTADVFVRGAVPLAVVHGGSTTAVSAEGAATWTEKRVPGVTSIVVGEVTDRAACLPAHVGVVAATGFVAELDGAASVLPASAPAAPPASAPAPAAKAPQRDDDGVAEETIIAPSSEPAPPAPEPAPAARVAAPPQDDDDASGDGSYDHLFGETVIHTISDAATHLPDPEADAVAAAEPDAGQAQADGLEEHTVMSQDIGALRAKRRKARTAQAEPEPQAVRLFLESSTGSREYVEQGLLLGRAPVLERSPGGAIPRLVKVVTPNQELSRTHAEVRVEGGAVVVTDLHSKNGVFVTLPGKSETRLREGEPTTVIPGTLVDLGDGAVYTVGEERA